MKQTFTIGKLSLIQDDLGYSVVEENKKDEAEIIASFKYPLDALKYFTEYTIYCEELKAIKIRTEEYDKYIKKLEGNKDE